MADNDTKVTVKAIEEKITATLSSLKDSYITKNSSVTEDAFKKKAASEIEKCLKDTYSDNILSDDSIKAHIDEYSTNATKEYYERYTTELEEKRTATLTDKYTIQYTTISNADVDPLIENGKSYIALQKQILKNGIPQGKPIIVKRENTSIFHATNASFSGCDMVCSIEITPTTGKKITTVLGTLQTLSYSIHQEKNPVRVLGNLNAKDWVFGARTIAGSLVFAVLNQHWLVDLYDQLYNDAEMKGSYFIADEIPPFNITVSFSNEYGFDSKMVLYGVRIIDEGQSMSINDLYIENTYQFVASGINYMDTLNNYQVGESKMHSATGVIKVYTASSRKVEEKETAPTENKNTNSTLTQEEEMSLEKAKTMLTVTKEQWLMALLNSNGNIDTAETSLKDELKTKYDAIKEEKEFISVKANKKAVDEYYSAAKKAVSSFKKQTNDNLVVYSKVPLEEQDIQKIDTALSFNLEKWNTYLKSEDTPYKAKEAYKKELEEALAVVKIKIKNMEINTNSYDYALSLYNNTLGRIDTAYDYAKEEKDAAE